MSEKTERRYRRLLALYPRDHRERHGEEMLGVLLAAGGGWRDGVDLLGGAIALHLRRVFGLDGGVHRRDVLSVVSLLGPIILVAGAATNLHELAWWIVNGALGDMPFQQIMDSPSWAVWLVVAVLVLFGLRRTAAVGAWLANLTYIVLISVPNTGIFWRFGDAGWLLLGIFTAAALTWSPGPVHGRELVGRRGVLTAVATVPAVIVLQGLSPRLYALSGRLWQYGPLIVLGVLAAGVYLACRPVKNRRTGRRAAFVLALPAGVAVWNLVLASVVGPPLYWISAVEAVLFYGVPTLVVLAGMGITRPMGAARAR